MSDASPVPEQAGRHDAFLVTPDAHDGRRLALFCAAVAAVLLLLFLVFEATGASRALAPDLWLKRAGLPAVLASVAVLALDAVLPVPSSLVMVANGSLFGLVGGAAVSAVGSSASSLLAFSVGRRLRCVAGIPGEGSATRSGAALARWGAIAVLLSRPVPLLAETVAVAAGTAGLDPVKFTVASLAGAIPPAVVYAWVGSSAAGADSRVPLIVLYVLLGLSATAAAGRKAATGPAPVETGGAE